VNYYARLVLHCLKHYPISLKHRAFILCWDAYKIWGDKLRVYPLLQAPLHRSVANKREQLENLLVNSNIDFLGLSETWLTCSSPEALIVMPKDRDHGKGGGVLLFVKSTVKCKQIECITKTDIECVGVNISLSVEMTFSLIFLYR